MDAIIITAAVVLAAICIIEIVSYFVTAPLSGTPAYISVLPVFENDEELSERLEYLAIKSCGRRRVIIVDYSASSEQSELCRGFVNNSPDAVFISAEELEKTMHEESEKGNYELAAEARDQLFGLKELKKKIVFS